MTERRSRDGDTVPAAAAPDDLSYGGYLQLDPAHRTAAGQPARRTTTSCCSSCQHQTTELWLKLVLHELRARAGPARRRRMRLALKCLARVKHIQRTLTEQWSVLATLTPSEYAEFRGFSRHVVGLPVRSTGRWSSCWATRTRDAVAVFGARPERATRCSPAAAGPSLYDEFLRYLARHGLDGPGRRCSTAT